MKHKKLINSLVAIFTVIIFFFVFLLVWFFGDKYSDFSGFTKGIEIPGLKEGAVPQGMGNWTYSYTDGDGASRTQQYFFISAYMTDGSPSRVYVTGEDTGYLGYVTLKNTDGSDYKGHCGGIALNNTTLWVSSDHTVFVAKAASGYTNIVTEILAKAQAEDDGEGAKTVSFTASFDANCEASFLYYYDYSNDKGTTSTSVTNDLLYVGEFYRKGNYETASSHRLTTPDGYANTAFAYEYQVSASGIYGLSTLTDDNLSSDNKAPEVKKIISIPEKIQGFARSGNYLVLSQSYGLANSHLLVYNWSKLTETSNSTTFSLKYDGIRTVYDNEYIQSQKVYYADNNDSAIFVNDYSIPSMSEGMCANKGVVYVLFESAGKKYNKFVRQQLKNVYGFIPEAA